MSTPAARRSSRRGPDVGAVFGALSDPTRRAVLRRLSDDDVTVTATALSTEFGMSRQAIAKHLRALADAGLVVATREGRETRFRAAPGSLDEAVAWMAETSGRWDARLERLRRRVESQA